MKIFYNDLNLRLQRREDDFYGVDLMKEPDPIQGHFPNLSPGIRYVFTDSIGIWTTEEKPPGFEKFRKLEEDKLKIVCYNLNRTNLKSITFDIKGVMHPEQENWAKYWIGSSIHGEERVRILESPGCGEILINDRYFQIFELHLTGHLRHGGKTIGDEWDKKLYHLGLGEYNERFVPEYFADPKISPALLLCKFSEPQKINERFVPEYFIEGHISLIKAGNGFRKRS